MKNKEVKPWRGMYKKNVLIIIVGLLRNFAEHSFPAPQILVKFDPQPKDQIHTGST